MQSYKKRTSIRTAPRRRHPNRERVRRWGERPPSAMAPDRLGKRARWTKRPSTRGVDL
jgi:hypothetical protein